MMNEDSAVLWYYVSDGQQRGPVDEEAFALLVRAGDVTGATLVWRSGMSEWLPYAAAAGGPGARCAYCGKPFPADELVDFSGTRVCAVCKPVFVQKYAENAQAAGRLGMRYAGFWVRFGAYFVDNIILSVLTYAVLIPLAFVIHSNESVAGAVVFQGVSIVWSMLVSCVYNAVPLVKWGATPGKMMCGLKVVRSDGSPLTYGRAFGRYFGEMLSGMIFCVGYLMAAFDRVEHKALHDIICDTRVIHK